MNSKTCEECGVAMLKKPKETYSAWDRRRFCSHRCSGRNMRPVINDEARFWSMVQKTDTCWLWSGVLTKGYGHFRLWGRSWGSHQIAYKLVVGEVPSGLELDHLCRNRACVKPEHLEPVTPLENKARSPLSNISKTHCKRGHEFTADNIVKVPGGKACKTCKHGIWKEWYARQNCRANAI